MRHDNLLEIFGPATDQNYVVITDREKIIGDNPVYEPSPLEPLLVEKVYHGSNEDEFDLHYSRDVSLLLNQQRLSKELQPLLADAVQRMRNTVDLSDDYKNLSDDDLIDTIRSRYIQSPSELKSWLNYLGENMKSLADKLGLSKKDDKKDDKDETTGTDDTITVEPETFNRTHSVPQSN